MSLIDSVCEDWWNGEMGWWFQSVRFVSQDTQGANYAQIQLAKNESSLFHTYNGL